MPCKNTILTAESRLKQAWQSRQITKARSGVRACPENGLFLDKFLIVNRINNACGSL
jgi:hypothetical protein